MAAPKSEEKSIGRGVRKSREMTGPTGLVMKKYLDLILGEDGSQLK